MKTPLASKEALLTLHRSSRQSPASEDCSSCIVHTAICALLRSLNPVDPNLLACTLGPPQSPAGGLFYLQLGHRCRREARGIECHCSTALQSSLCRHTILSHRGLHLHRPSSSGNRPSSPHRCTLLCAVAAFGHMSSGILPSHHLPSTVVGRSVCKHSKVSRRCR